MKQVTDYYFDLQNITDIDDCSDNCNENVLIMFKQIIKSILKDNTEYDIAILDNESELFKMSGGDGATTFPYKQFEEVMNFLFQRSKFMQEKKDDLYNSLFYVEKNNDSNVPSENVVTHPVIDTAVPPVIDTPVSPVSPVVDATIHPLVDTAVPPVVDTAVPPVVDTTVPPVLDTAVPPLVDAAVPHDVDTAVPPVVDAAVPPVVDAAVPPVVDNNSNNPDVNTQPPSNQIGGYKRMQQRLFKDITNVITVKLSVYNNNFKNSFIRKIRYSQ